MARYAHRVWEEMRRGVTPAVRVNTTAVLESMNYVKTYASS